MKNAEESAFEALVSTELKTMNEIEFEEHGSITALELIVCPYCFKEMKAEYGDWENAPYTESEYCCPTCEKYFSVDCEPHVEFIFSSKRVDQ